MKKAGRSDSSTEASSTDNIRKVTDTDNDKDGPATVKLKKKS